MRIVKILTNAFVIISGTITFMIMVIIAVIKIYDLTLNDSKRSHQLQQMEMAKAAGNGISTHLDHIVKDMHLLTDFEGIQDLEPSSVSTNVNHLFNHYDREDVLSIFIADSDANLIHIEGDSLPDWIMPLLKKQIDNSRYVNDWNNCWYSLVDHKDQDDFAGGMVFIMVIPILPELDAENKSNKQIAGFVCYLVSFDNLVDKFIAPLNLSNHDFAWILDGRSRLIFHPNHEEMLLRNTKDIDSGCISCHSSFDVQNRMVSGEGSFAEYNIGTEPTKIMAYYPIDLINEKWVVAISTFLPEVTSNLRGKFQLFFILGVFILIAISSYGLSLYYVNSKRIRAEEAQRQSEKMQKLQEQLNQASKLASIGELVDTVAHELNTPAGIIAAQADAILLQLENPDLFSEELSVIKNQTRRISKYTRSLLSYSKRIPFHPELVKVNEIIDECVYLLMHRFRAHNISIIKNYQDDLPELRLDLGQIEQVFVNLLNNAVDAIKYSGEIIINVSIAVKNSSLINYTTIEGLNISISDNGHGIKSDVIDQIFEPFYSSKIPTKGSGLGLSITKAIIQRHGGKIEVTSSSSKGTTFRIFLPYNFKQDI
ncbi:MAG: sensor histidine kinase [Bacteroidetes bacterium]|nr:sensor histidine kinase [Bacteroidota bacterium]